MKKRKMSFTTVGGSSILTIFAVLCFIVFALLSLSTAKADSMLANKSTDAVVNYYKADIRAEEILAKLREGQLPEGVSRMGNGGTYCYSCPIDENQELQVVVDVWADKYLVQKWQKKYTGEWQTDTSMNVWGGTEEIAE